MNKKNVFKSVLKAGGWYLALLLLLSFFIVPACSKEKTVHYETTLSRPVERAIEVAGLENKFIHIEHVGFGGAGAGGMGTAEISTGTAKEFLALVPKDEKIYVSLGYPKYNSVNENRYSLERKYWAFIENRAGLVSFTETYSVKDEYKNDVEITDFDEEKAYHESTSEYVDFKKLFSMTFIWGTPVFCIIFICYLFEEAYEKKNS